ncbi:universal stress protein [Shewanella sp. JM162201]|uniref:Universal stress protein n=1 Tax=Shewanella jiangmenensis TaxID=2837387 RepID=A0ABS5V192_9GAMM|nr:universal stress protein [Shewanella jiangmenensis]MBT1444246.1 universal stress protein [Shewanella jiangmenensis]
MEKVFIIAQHPGSKTDTVTEGLALARALDAAPALVSYDYAYFAGDEYYNPRLAAAARQALLEQRRQALVNKLAEQGESTLQPEARWSKTPHQDAIDASSSGGFSLLIKGIDDAEAPAPTDWHLIRHTRTPLMLLTNNPLARGRCVLMAVDLDASSEDKQLLNQLVLAHGRRLAAALSLPLHLACVIRVPTILRDMDLVTPHEILKAAHEKHSETLKSLGLPAEQIHLVTGEPELCLYQLSSSLKAKYLVLGARKREGLFGTVIGSTAEALVHRVRCNLLILPPDPQWLPDERG